MQRRELLTAVGGSMAAFAGCQDDPQPASDDAESDDAESDDAESDDAESDDAESDDAESDDAEPDDTESSEPLEIGDTAPDHEVTVTSVSVQKSFVDVSAWRTIYHDPDGQFILIETGEEPPEFVPVFDGEVATPLEQLPPTGSNIAYALGAAVDDAAAADTAAIALERSPDVRWRLPDEALDRLANRPNIRVLDATVVDRGGNAALRFELENVGDRDGLFRAIVASPVGADLDGDISIPVPVGEAVTETVQNNIITDWDVDHDLGEVAPDQRFFEQSETD